MSRWLWCSVLALGAGLLPFTSIQGQDAPATKPAAVEQPAEKTDKPAEKSPAKTETTTKKTTPLPTPGWGHIEISGSYPESAQLPGLFSELSESLSDALNRIEKAADDVSVQGLILRLNEPQIGWGKLNEFRQAIAKVRAAGKKVIAYTESGSNADYAIATACDEIVLPESAVLMTVGMRAEVSFYKNLFDKLDIKADMLRVGEFKSAAEPYNRTEMSPEFRKELEDILDNNYQLLVGYISESRKLTKEQVIAAIDESPLTAARAKELGLIDRLAYPDEVETALKGDNSKIKITRKYGKKKLDTDFSGITGMMKMMDLMMGIEQPKRRSFNSKVAIINAVGPITTGSSSQDPFSGESSIGSDTLIKAIRTANEDETVKTIVMRVDSPGGSALASDLIWRELERVKKPFVVSMGDVAGSGGYYIAMNADKIYAEPGTITGSIGVVGGKIATQGLFEKVGITTSIISRGKNSGVMSMTTPFNDSEREAFQRLLNDIYKVFTTKAAAGRKMEYDQLEKLARGRIYSGLQAKELGLVDEIGTLEDAIVAAHKLAGIKPEEKLERMVLPKAVSPFEALLGPIDARAMLANQQSQMVRTTLEHYLPGIGQHLGVFGTLSQLAREPRLVLMPYRITIK